MALTPSDGYVAASSLQDSSDNALPIFNVERVQLQFSIASDFVAAQVANNVLILALSTGRILRIDLDSPADIDGLYTKLHALRVCNMLRLGHHRHRPTKKIIGSWSHPPHVS